MRLLLATLIAALPACGKSAAECRSEAAALSALLIAASAEPPSLLWFDDTVHPVARTDLTTSDRGGALIVTLTAEWIRLRDDPVADAEALQAGLAAEFEALRDLLASGRVRPEHVPEPRLIYLVIDAATPWHRVVPVVRAATAAGYAAVAFVFTQPSTATPPPRSGIDDQIDALDPAERASGMAKLIEARVKRCPALVDAFGRLYDGSPAVGPARRLAEAVGPALVDCRCRADLPELRSLLFGMMYVPRPARVVALDPEAAAELVALPAATPWSEASRRLSPATTNVRFTVSDEGD